MRRRQWRALLTAPRDVLLFVAANAALQWGEYSRRALALAERAGDADGIGYFMLYTAALALVIACALVGVGALERWWRGDDGEPAQRRVAPWVVGVAEWLLWLLLIIDTKVFGILGVHLYQPAVWEALSGENVAKELQLNGATLASLGAVVGLVGLGEWALYRGCRWVSGRGRAQAWAWLHRGVVAGAGVSACLAVALKPAHTRGALIAQSMPLFEELLAKEGVRFEGAGVTYPAVGAPREVALKRTPDILWIQAESLRADHANEDLMPQLRAFAQDPANHCIEPKRHYASAQTTERATFSLLYGLDAYQYVPFAEAQARSYPLALLKRAGYALSGVSASSLKRFKGAGFIVDNFDAYEEHLRSDYGEDDRLLVERAKALLGERREAPQLLFLFFFATHHNYFYPPAFERFQPVLPIDYDHMVGDLASPQERERTYNRYRNSVGYLDALFGELMGALGERLRRGELVLVFVGDHGEEFWEHGLFGHSAPMFVEERVRVPLLVCLPGQPQVEVALSSHVDVWPTLLDYLSDAPPQEADYTQGRSLLKPAPPLLSRFIVGLDFPHDHPTACVVGERHKLWVELCKGSRICLETFRVTTLDDGLSLTPPSAEDKRSYFQDFDEKQGRFVRWRARD